MVVGVTSPDSATSLCVTHFPCSCPALWRQAAANPAGYALAPAVVVTQTLVELTGMVVLTRVVSAWLVPDGPN